jgi:hypothetical protein
MILPEQKVEAMLVIGDREVTIVVVVESLFLLAFVIG